MNFFGSDSSSACTPASKGVSSNGLSFGWFPWLSLLGISSEPKPPPSALLSTGGAGLGVGLEFGNFNLNFVSVIFFFLNSLKVS
jgi:hypothetical protein